MVWNVHYGYGGETDHFAKHQEIEVNGTLEAIADFIKAADVDFVLLQEVDRAADRTYSQDQLKILAERADFPYYVRDHLERSVYSVPVWSTGSLAWSPSQRSGCSQPFSYHEKSACCYPSPKRIHSGTTGFISIAPYKSLNWMFLERTPSNSSTSTLRRFRTKSDATGEPPQRSRVERCSPR